MNRAVVEMRFADGEVIRSWLSFQLRDTFTDPIGQLDFEVAPPRSQIGEYRERLARGQLVSVLVDGATQGSFLVQTRTNRIGKDGVVMGLQCTSPLVGPYQAHVNPRLSFKSQTDAAVTDVVLRALSPFGFETIVGDQSASVNALTGKPIGRQRPAVSVPALKIQEAQAQDGETTYAFCSRIFTRLGVALRMAADGTLLLAAPDYEQETAYTLVQDFDGRTPGDRFLAEPPIEIVDSNDDQFSECTVTGSRSDSLSSTRAGTPVARVTADELNPNRPSYSSFAQPFKPLYIKDKNARDVERCRSVAKLALGIRAPRGFQVSGAVDGFKSRTGRVWSINTMARTFIAAEGLDEDMWIHSRTLIQDRQQGQMTQLQLLRKGALVLGDVPSG